MAESRANWNFVQVNLAAYKAALQQAQENATRRATVDTQYKTTGAGQKRQVHAIEFPVKFITEPHLVTGCGTLKNPDPATWHDPVGMAGVYRWKMDKAGYFTGAFIWIRVEISSISGSGIIITDAGLGTGLTPKNLKTMIYLTFSGTAVKDVDVPDYNALKTRTVSLG